MKIAIGCDPNAMELKKIIIDFLNCNGHEVKDFGSTDPIYAKVGIKLAENVAAKNHDIGILICGTGIGMQICANKVQGAYAAVPSDVYSATKARTSNNSNILCIGAFTTGCEVAKNIVDSFINSTFDPESPSAPKVEYFVEYEKHQAP